MFIVKIALFSKFEKVIDSESLLRLLKNRMASIIDFSINWMTMMMVGGGDVFWRELGGHGWGKCR
jgi:hypothetical protein